MRRRCADAKVDGSFRDGDADAVDQRSSTAGKLVERDAEYGAHDMEHIQSSRLDGSSLKGIGHDTSR